MSTTVMRRRRTGVSPAAPELIPAKEVQEPEAKATPARRARPVAKPAAPAEKPPATVEPETPATQESEAGSSRTDYDGICNKYRASATNRRSAIRAMCVICMGGMIQEVAKCTSQQCPLFMFRMGDNPNDARTIAANAKKAAAAAELAAAAAAAKPTTARRPARRK